MRALPALVLLLLLGAGCGSKGASGSPTPGAGTAGSSSQTGGNGSGGASSGSGNGTGAAAGAGVGGAGTGGTPEPPFTSDELLINGNAEQGLTGWTSAPNMAIVAESYGATDYPAASDPGPKARGDAFFRGSDNLSVDAHQVVDITPFADQIMRGARFKLSAYLGGYLAQDDHAAVGINLMSADGVLLETSTLGGPLAAERMGITGLVACSLDGQLPEATRSIDVHLVLRRAGGTGNDGYADNLSLVLHN